MTELLYPPIQGKTYSLFGDSETTFGYYRLIKSLADEIMLGNDLSNVIRTIQRHSSGKRNLRKITRGAGKGSLISNCLMLINEELKQFTRTTEKHLKDLPLLKLWDRRLSTTEEQYHLYMLEIELTNRLNRKLFISSDRKISLQPHCLQDFSVQCKARSDGFDYRCRNCSHNCYQNRASSIISENGIESYIWMGASIKNTIRDSHRKHQTIGILGIACIPELVWGMRKCGKLRIPVVGIPLNANRCTRWFGEFHPNSIDLSELERLLKH